MKEQKNKKENRKTATFRFDPNFLKALSYIANDQYGNDNTARCVERIICYHIVRPAVESQFCKSSIPPVGSKGYEKAMFKLYLEIIEVNSGQRIAVMAKDVEPITGSVPADPEQAKATLRQMQAEYDEAAEKASLKIKCTLEKVANAKQTSNI